MYYPTDTFLTFCDATEENIPLRQVRTKLYSLNIAFHDPVNCTAAVHCMTQQCSVF